MAPTDSSLPDYQNAPAKRMFGTIGDDFNTARDAYMRKVHPMDMATVGTAMANTYQGAAQDYEYRTIEEGRILWFRSQTFPVRNEAGKVATVVGLLEEITDRKEQEARRDVIERRERLTSLGSLVAGVAHEVNNPLTYLVGNVALARTEIARASSDNDGRSAEHLARADKLLVSAAGGGERIARIVKALRAVTQNRSGVERSVVDLNTLAANVRELMNANLPQGVTIDVLADAAEPQVMARSDELHQVVLNLATNAVQALGAKGGHVRITTTTEGPLAVLHVIDDGVGMSKETQRKLFTPFFTTKTEGTGLGLSIVHGIVRDHGGEIDVDSRLGVGTDFRLRLPLVATAPQATAVAPLATGARP
jgi:signal transduction histidine kinase